MTSKCLEPIQSLNRLEPLLKITRTESDISRKDNSNNFSTNNLELPPIQVNSQKHHKQNENDYLSLIFVAVMLLNLK